MQSLMSFSSENGGVECLNLFQANVSKFSSSKIFDSQIKIPHIGWNKVRYTLLHKIWHNIPDHSYFYFVHSYCVSAAAQIPIAAVTDYGQDFACAVIQDNIFAVQFHPEKSGQVGLQFYKNFINW